ncbi:MAG: gliding motility-associated C-terminal domain-containing protein, partial [Cyclobacteriaceae bacterium]|nr:gliding motility-associated C-terminal domain-containing protein [Cyclobacteriaceae bacterium]
FANVATGEIDLVASTAGGPYTVTYTTAGPCPGSTTFDLTILPVNTVFFSLDNLSGNNGDEILVPVRVQGFTDILSAQFSVRWDPAIIQFLNVENLASITGLDLADFNSPGAGTLTFSWSSASAQSLADGLSLFDMRFELVGPECNFSSIRLENSPVSITVTGDNSCEAIVLTSNGSISISGSGISDPPLTAYADSISCLNDPIPQLSAAGINIKWYADPGLTIQVAATSIFTPVLNNSDLADTVFYATQTIGTCTESLPDSTRIQYIGVPDSPVPDQPVYTLCLFAAPPMLTASGTNIQWFADVALTIKLADGSAYVPGPGELDTRVEGSTIFYVTQDNQCGMSDYSEVEVEIIDCGVNCNDFEIATSSIDTSCPESRDGAISIVVVTPVPGINQYSLNGGSTYFDFINPNDTQTLDTFAVGTYEVLVRALGSGCFPDTALVTIGSQVIFTTTVDLIESTCGLSDGAITISVAGGSGDYRFTLFNPGGTSDSNATGVFNGLVSGIYHYDVEDNISGCTLTQQEVILNNSNAINAVADPDSFENALCFGESQGRAIIDVTGGPDDVYEYSLNGSTWNNFTSGEYIDNLPPNGTYIILIRDSSADLCFEQVQVTIENEYLPIGFTYSSTPASCDAADGSLTIESISGGLEPYEISIGFEPFTAVDLNNLPVFNNLSGGFKNIRIQDANGCVHENDQVFVDFPGILNADIQVIPPTCSGEGRDGIITIYIDSGINTIPPPYTFGIAAADTPENGVDLHGILPDNMVTVDTLMNGSYYVLLVPENGCQSRTDIDVTGGPYVVDFSVTAVVDAGCKDGTGSVRIDDITGDPGFDFNIALIALPSMDPVFSENYSYGEIAGGLTIDGSVTDEFVAGEYRVLVRQDQNGCNLVAISEDFTISEPGEYLDFEVRSIKNSLSNFPTGSISIRIDQSGSAPYETSIDMRTPFFPGQDDFRDWAEVPENAGNYDFIYEELYSGVYDVSVRDEAGCEITKEVSVPYDSALFVPNIFTPNDDDHNDYFEISNLPKSGSGTSLIITNRWGNIIFESDNYNEDNLWNGGDNPDGTYYYRLNIPNQGSYSGWVEIWRGR